MRRPNRTQALRRRTALLAVPLVALAALVALAGRGATRDSDATPTTVATTPAAERPVVLPTTTEATTTTRPTGVFVPATLADGPVAGNAESPLHTYRVEVEDGTGQDPDTFATEVERILSDPRGWTTADGLALQRVQGGDAQIVITLATPGTVDLLCYPLDTSDGDVSCAKEGRAIINLERWLDGAEASGLDLTEYREYLIGHEVGHVLGHHHEPCPGPGLPAPVMLQQTLGIGECTPNPWPMG